MRPEFRLWLGIILATTFGALAVYSWRAGDWVHALLHLALGLVFVGIATRVRPTV